MAKLLIPSVGTASPAPPSSDESPSTPPIPITTAWSLDLAGQRLVGPAGEVLLPALEFRVLQVFRRHPHAVLSREQLLNAAWGEDFVGTDRVVDRAVCWLRRVLEPDPAHPRTLRTRRGAGYTYCPPPSAS